MQLAQDQLQKKNDELIALYQEKCKKHTQMTNLYNLLKSRAMRSQIQTAASDSVSQTLKSLPQATNPRLNASLLPQTAMTASRHFDALPSTEKRNGKNSTVRLFRHQRSGSASSKSKEDRFMADVGAMPPPQLPFSGMVLPLYLLQMEYSS
jgi:E3 ubiquitin-protein ligase CCNP1IP1